MTGITEMMTLEAGPGPWLPVYCVWYGLVAINCKLVFKLELYYLPRFAERENVVNVNDSLIDKLMLPPVRCLI